MKNEIKKFCSNVKTKAVALSTLAMAALPSIVHADGALNTGGEASNMIISIATVVVDIFPFVGIFFVLSGVFKLINAYRNDQPEAQAGAAKDIVIGVVFIVFRAFVWGPVSNAIFA